MLFFSRAIEIAGDTAVVVALRNTLDRDLLATNARAGAGRELGFSARVSF